MHYENFILYKLMIYIKTLNILPLSYMHPNNFFSYRIIKTILLKNAHIPDD